jgi:biotin-dependent carboxylase-like uncharacterized protein
MDWISHASANAIIGNPAGAAVVEVGPAGMAFTAGDTQQMAIVAPGFRVLRAGSAVPSGVVMTIRAGMRVDIQPGPWGVWGYVALPGGVAGEPVMGSMATHLRSGLGGAALGLGDVVAAAGAGVGGPDRCLIDAAVERAAPPICYVPGPQDGLFEDGALMAGSFAVSARSDRMAYRLNGPPLRAAGGHDIVSDGTPLGAIQVPGDGQPFVLMADRQPTGGYPKIGTVIRADLPRLAQMRAGEALRFQAVTVDAAVDAFRAAIERVASLPGRLREMRFLRDR